MIQSSMITFHGILMLMAPLSLIRPTLRAMKSDTLAYPHPTYSLYPVLAELEEVKIAQVPWERDWSLPIDGLLATKARAIFLANPNAPSGTFVSPQRIEELCKRFNGVVLIDEAYVDFADDNCLPPRRE